MPLERSRKPIERFNFKPYTKVRPVACSQGRPGGFAGSMKINVAFLL